jgi:DNA primase
LITEDEIRQVRDATDIVALISERVVLKQRGREFWGCCPFHNEKTPSFKVDPASQFYHCFGCGEGGDVFKFLMRMEDIAFPEAVRSLAARANIELAEEVGSRPRGRKAVLLAVCEETTAFYHFQLKRAKGSAADAARAYLASRDMGGELPTLWQLGYAPGSAVLVHHLSQKGFSVDDLIEANVAVRSDGGRGSLRDRFYNRVIFPIKDLQGRPIAFGGRVIDQGEPKYLNSSDTPLFRKRDNLYAIDRARSQMTAEGCAIVVEGYTDAIAMHAAGFTNTVATLGTALTPQHIKLLARFTSRVVLLFDGDEAGLRAADRATDLISVAASEQARKADLLVAVLPKASDPADLCAQEGGAALMRTLIDAAEPLLRFSLDRRLERWDLTRPEQRSRALSDVTALLVPLNDTLLVADYLNYLADIFATEYAVVASTLEKARAQAPALRARVLEPSTTQAAGQRAVGQRAAGQAQAAQTQDAEQTRPVVDRVTSMERELLFLYIEQPEVRARLREAFERITWSDERHGNIATALLALDAEAKPDEMLSLIVARKPDSAELLSGARLAEFAGATPNRLAGMLMFAIKEGQLKAAIRNENAQLRLLGEGEDVREQRDALFRRVSALQQELANLRRRYQSESS